MNNKCRSEILLHLLVSTSWEWLPAQCSGTSSTWLALNMSEGWSKCFASSNFLLSPLFCQVELMKKELQRDSFQLLPSWLNVARYLPLLVRAGERCDRNSWHTSLPKFKGVAVQLQHGTVISWDARIIRHCTSMPHHGKDRKTHGTYFGLCGRVAKILKEKQKEKPTRFSSEKVSYSK